MAAVRQVGTFDDGLIDHIERMLEFAFMPASRRTDSALAQFDGRKRDKKSRSIPLKNTSAKWSERHNATETRAAQFSKPLIQDADWDHIAIVRAVNELPELSLCWIKFKYMPRSSEQFDFGARVGRMFWTIFQAQFSDGAKAEVRHSVKRFADTLLLCENDPMLAALVAASKPWEAFGIERDAWYKTYRDYWNALKAELRQIHCEALMMVFGRL